MTPSVSGSTSSNRDAHGGGLVADWTALAHHAPDVTDWRSTLFNHLVLSTASIELVDWHDRDAEQLRDRQQADIAIRYGGPDAQPDPETIFTDVESIIVTVLVRVGDQPVATGSVRQLSGVPDEVGGVHPPGTGEVKRVYVAPGFRGHGLARLVMRELESRAVAAGITRLVLETGTAQPEAMGLYESMGYRSVAQYGPYADSPECRCMGKELSSHSPAENSPRSSDR